MSPQVVVMGSLRLWRWYEETLPKGIGKARRDLGHLHLKWMVEKKIEENQGMMKEEVMRNGMKRGVFREGNSLDEILDFGKHAGKTFRQVYMEDPLYCNWTVREIKPGVMKLKQFKFFLRRI